MMMMALLMLSLSNKLTFWNTIGDLQPFRIRWCYAVTQWVLSQTGINFYRAEVGHRLEEETRVLDKRLSKIHFKNRTLPLADRACPAGRRKAPELAGCLSTSRTSESI